VLNPGGFDATVRRQKEEPEERTLEIWRFSGSLKRKKLPFAKPTNSNGLATKSSDLAVEGNFVPLRVNFLTTKGTATSIVETCRRLGLPSATNSALCSWA
jgi:hypothetical protein